MVADMSPTAQNDSLFDILGQLIEEVNQSNLDMAEGDHLDADIVKVWSQTLIIGWLGPSIAILLVRGRGSANDFHWLLGRGLQSRLIHSLFQTEMSPNISQVDTPPLFYLLDSCMYSRGESLSCSKILESQHLWATSKMTLKCPGKVCFKFPCQCRQTSYTPQKNLFGGHSLRLPLKDFTRKSSICDILLLNTHACCPGCWCCWRWLTWCTWWPPSSPSPCPPSPPPSTTTPTYTPCPSHCPWHRSVGQLTQSYDIPLSRQAWCCQCTWPSPCRWSATSRCSTRWSPSATTRAPPTSRSPCPLSSSPSSSPCPPTSCWTLPVSRSVHTVNKFRQSQSKTRHRTFDS